MSLPTSIKQLDKFVSHSPGEVSASQASELTVRKLTERDLRFIPCWTYNEPAHVQFEVYDTKLSRDAITNERLKFIKTLHRHGDYQGTYNTNSALPENWNLKRASEEERLAEAEKYEQEYLIWITKYDLRNRHTGEKVTVEQLNRDLEDYISKHPSDKSTNENEDTSWDHIETSFRAMAIHSYRQGEDAHYDLTRNRLDYELDAYMAKGNSVPQMAVSPAIDPEDRFADEDFD